MEGASVDSEPVTGVNKDFQRPDQQLEARGRDKDTAALELLGGIQLGAVVPGIELVAGIVAADVSALGSGYGVQPQLLGAEQKPMEQY